MTEEGTVMAALLPDQFVTHDYAGDLSSDQLLAMLESMVLSRKLDERMWVLNRQGKVPFHISGMGHEACQVLVDGSAHVAPFFQRLPHAAASDQMIAQIAKGGDVGRQGEGFVGIAEGFTEAGEIENLDAHDNNSE